MDNETAKYIINYFSHLLTGEEKMAIKHTTSIYKLEDSSSKVALEKVYRQKGWITSDQNVLNLLKNGYDQFEIVVANRIISQNKEKVFLNKCPKCNKLARTPFAKQCRHCGHNWHNQ